MSINSLASEGFLVFSSGQMNGQYYLIAAASDDNTLPIEAGEIKLFTMPFKGICSWTARISFHICQKEQKVALQEVMCRRENCGYGSALMKAFITFAQWNKCDTILGAIHPVDFDHVQKLIHFYQKFGFDVDFSISEANEVKRISLDLTEYPEHEN